jgi:hypothetical protein
MFGILDHRGGKVSACVEEVVLNLPEYVANLLSGVSQCDGDADRGIGLVAVGICREPSVIL